MKPRTSEGHSLPLPAIRKGTALRVTRNVGETVSTPDRGSVWWAAEGHTPIVMFEGHNEWSVRFRDGMMIVSRLIGRGALLAFDVEPYVPARRR